MTADSVILAEKAVRIKEDIAPYLAQMEAEAFEAALACNRATQQGQDQANDYLRVVAVIRGLTGKLDVAITEGKQRARTEGVRFVA